MYTLAAVGGERAREGEPDEVDGSVGRGGYGVLDTGYAVPETSC